jgi:hypothetical protein
MKEPAFSAALRLIEDSLVLAKRADATAWIVYLAGVVPFFGMLLFAMSDLAQSPFAFERLSLIALALAFLYCWMHVCQSVFCGYLNATLAERNAEPRAHFAQAFSTQPAVAASKLILWPLTMVLLIPHAVVTMFYQHSLLPPVGAETQSVRWSIREAKRDALYRQGQVVWMLLLVLLVRAILWMNLFGLLLFGPWLWKTFTGVEGKLTRAPELLINPTSLVALSILAYIGLDPIVKAACAIRRFARQSESSGLDLRLRIAALRRAAAVLTLCALCLPVRSVAASVSTPANAPTVSSDRMRQAIESVFRDPQNHWDLPIVQKRKLSPSPLGSFIDSIMNRIDAVWGSIRSGIITLLKALHHIFSRTNQGPEPRTGAVSGADVWAVIAVFALLLAGAVLLVWRNRRKRIHPQTAAATAIEGKNVDITREDVQAIDQPEDEWLRLAQQHHAAGNLRLALRALYLSTLAAFGRNGFISLARGKSNLDYLHELQRRAKRLNREFVPLFRTNLRLFEESWYGDHGVTEEMFVLFERNSSALRDLI